MSCCNAVLVAFLPEVPTEPFSLQQPVAVCRSVLFPSHQSIVGKESRVPPGGAPVIRDSHLWDLVICVRAACLYLAAYWCASAFTWRILAPSTVPHKAIPALDKMTSFAEWSEAVHLNRWHSYVCVLVTWGHGSSHVCAYLCKQWSVKTKPKQNPSRITKVLLSFYQLQSIVHDLL